MIESGIRNIAKDFERSCVIKALAFDLSRIKRDDMYDARVHDTIAIYFKFLEGKIRSEKTTADI